MSRRRGPVSRTRTGTFRLALHPGERALLARLAEQLRQLLVHTPGDPVLARLFPPAYAEAGDAEAEAEYRRLMGDDLLSGRLGALDVLEQTLEADEIDEAQALRWLGALNDVRLVLGTRLDVRDDEDLPDLGPDHPDALAVAAYAFCTALVATLVEELAGWRRRPPRRRAPFEGG